MRDPGRIDQIIDALRDAWHMAPDQRFGQFIDNLQRTGEFSFRTGDNEYRCDIRNLEDDRWLKALEKELADGEM